MPNRLLQFAEPACLASKVTPRRSVAHAIRASLLASATTTVLRCRRVRRPRSHAPSGVWLRASDGKAALAPWIKSVRRYLLPRLEMPSSLGLPPVEYCRGTIPSHAPRSRALPNAEPSPTAATSAVALRAPIPGIDAKRRVAASSRARSMNSRSALVRGSNFNVLQLCGYDRK